MSSNSIIIIQMFGLPRSENIIIIISWELPRSERILIKTIKIELSSSERITVIINLGAAEV